MEHELISLFLVPGPRDSNSPDQQELRHKLQQSLQKYLNAFGPVLTESLKCWLQGGTGRKVRMEGVVAGKANEAGRVEEIDALIEALKHRRGFTKQ